MRLDKQTIAAGLTLWCLIQGICLSATVDEFYNQIAWGQATNQLAQGVFMRRGERTFLLYATSKMQQGGLAFRVDGARWLKLTAMDSNGREVGLTAQRASKNEHFESLKESNALVEAKQVVKRVILPFRGLKEIGKYDLQVEFGDKWDQVKLLRVEQIAVVYGLDRKYHAVLLPPVVFTVEGR